MDTPARRVWFGIAPPTPQELDRITPQEPSPEPEPPTGIPGYPRLTAWGRERASTGDLLRGNPGWTTLEVFGIIRCLDPDGRETYLLRHADTFDPHEVGLALMELGWELSHESPDSF